jgi:hypothetical protein
MVAVAAYPTIGPSSGNMHPTLAFMKPSCLPRTLNVSMPFATEGVEKPANSSMIPMRTK